MPLKVEYEFLSYWVVVRYIIIMIIVIISEHRCVSGNVICTLHALAHLILMKTCEVSAVCYPYSTYEEAEDLGG